MNTQKIELNPTCGLLEREETFFLRKTEHNGAITTTTWCFLQQNPAKNGITESFEVDLPVYTSDWNDAEVEYGILLEDGVNVVIFNGWLIAICNGDDCTDMLETRKFLDNAPEHQLAEYLKKASA